MSNYSYEKFDDHNLIALVREHRFLYDKNQRLFKIPAAKMRAWKEIGEKLEAPPKDCMRRWSVLRDRFTKSCRSLDAADREFDNWHLFDNMRFLREHIVQRRFEKQRNPQRVRSDYEEVFLNCTRRQSPDINNDSSDVPEFAVEMLPSSPQEFNRQLKIERLEPEPAYEEDETQQEHTTTMHEDSQYMEELDSAEEKYAPKRKREQNHQNSRPSNNHEASQFYSLQKERLELQKEKIKLECEQLERLSQRDEQQQMLAEQKFKAEQLWKEREYALKEKQLELEIKNKEKEWHLREMEMKMKERILKYEMDLKYCKNGKK